MGLLNVTPLMEARVLPTYTCARVNETPWLKVHDLYLNIRGKYIKYLEIKSHLFPVI